MIHVGKSIKENTTIKEKQKEMLMLGNAEQFKELTVEINYAINKMYRRNKAEYPKGSWDVADYYEHMADFFDYIDLPGDAEEHRVWAEDWLNGRGKYGFMIKWAYVRNRKKQKTEKGDKE